MSKLDRMIFLFLTEVLNTVLSQDILKANLTNKTYHIFFSHLHYDHIQGIPFFAPAYIPGNKIIFHGCHNTIEQALKDQMRTPYFPIPFDTFAADISFEIHSPTETLNLCDVEITMRANHPGVSYGYRIDQGENLLFILQMLNTKN